MTAVGRIEAEHGSGGAEALAPDVGAGGVESRDGEIARAKVSEKRDRGVAGLASIQAALDLQRKGISARKIVVTWGQMPLDLQSL